MKTKRPDTLANGDEDDMEKRRKRSKKRGDGVDYSSDNESDSSDNSCHSSSSGSSNSSSQSDQREGNQKAVENNNGMGMRKTLMISLDIGKPNGNLNEPSKQVQPSHQHNVTNGIKTN